MHTRKQVKKQTGKEKDRQATDKLIRKQKNSWMKNLKTVCQTIRESEYKKAKTKDN